MILLTRENVLQNETFFNCFHVKTTSLKTVPNFVLLGRACAPSGFVTVQAIDHISKHRILMTCDNTKISQGCSISLSMWLNNIRLTIEIILPFFLKLLAISAIATSLCKRIGSF